jgi:hypothetical protein
MQDNNTGNEGIISRNFDRDKFFAILFSLIPNTTNPAALFNKV